MFIVADFLKKDTAYTNVDGGYLFQNKLGEFFVTHTINRTERICKLSPSVCSSLSEGQKWLWYGWKDGIKMDEAVVAYKDSEIASKALEIFRANDESLMRLLHLYSMGCRFFDIFLQNLFASDYLSRIRSQEIEIDEKRLIKKYLMEAGFDCLYHFTDVRNIYGIIANNGLFSLRELRSKGIKVFPGGGDLSHGLDFDRNIDDTVKLSFCRRHPMAYVKMKESPGRRFCLLRISLDALDENAFFSALNATDNKTMIKQGFLGLKEIPFFVPKIERYFDINDNESLRKCYQAEAMVKQVRIEHIQNLTNPERF